MSPGTRVVVDYLRGEPCSPFIVTALDPGIREASLPTKLPYHEAGMDMANLYLWEFVHQVGNLSSDDYRRMYPKLVSWLRMKTDGDVHFQHLQELPNPQDRIRSTLVQFTRKYFFIRLDPSNVLTLGWPFKHQLGAPFPDRQRTISHQVDAAGTIKLRAATEGETQAPFEVALTTDHHLTLTAQGLSLSYDGSKLVIQRGEAGLTLSETQVAVSAPGLTFNWQNNQLAVKTTSQITLDAPKLVLKAKQVDVDSVNIRMGKKSRNVAVVGSKTAYHSHKYYANGQQYNTTSVQAAIVDGAPEVKI
jgi:hypothetical protein